MKRNLLISLVEYLIVFVLLAGGISMFFADTSVAADDKGPLVRLLGSKNAAVVYGLWFISVASWLFLSKIFGLPKAKKHGLLAVYITSIWVFILELLLLGWTPYLIDEVILGAAAGILWLRWKMKTEYRDADEE
jgi:hypothetical protein